MAWLADFLKIKATQGLLRTLKPCSFRKGGRIYFNKKGYIDFSSNDYLGLSVHPELIKVSKNAIEKFGTASSASRLMSGDSELHHQLEDRIAKFKNKEAALFLNSGYQANIGIISALFGAGDCIFLDRLAHASIIDGALLSRAKFFRFQHNDTAHLESLLKKERSKFNKALIITESIFSMDGDKAPLNGLADLKEEYNFQIMVDEAHATGIFGENGGGQVEQEGLEEKIDFIMGTFSKALGGFGAYLATSRETVDYLINTCRPFIYSTALPPAIIACNLKAIDLVKKEPFRRVRLLESAAYLRNALCGLGFKVKGESQIIPVIIGDNFKAQKAAASLQKKGFWVLAIRPPTVPAGEARLRFSLSFCHGRRVLEKVIDELCKIGI
jgi:8-amino-7-oxononanoate synthase